MKRALLIIFLLIPVLFTFKALVPKGFSTDMDIEAVSQIPVQHGGRILPLDTLARNSLLILQGKQRVKAPEGKGTIAPIVWLLDVTMRPEVAATYKTFRIDHPQVLSLIDKTHEDGKLYSFSDLMPHFEALKEQAEAVNEQPELRTPFEQQIVKLYEALTRYNQLMIAFMPGGERDKLSMEYGTWQASITPGMEAIRDQAIGKEYVQEDMDRFIAFSDRYLTLSKLSPFGIVPSDEVWANIGQGLLDTLTVGQIPDVLVHYGDLTQAYRNYEQSDFNEALSTLQADYKETIDALGSKLKFEVFFNAFEPFYVSSVLYMIAFLGVCVFWLFKDTSWRKAANWIMILAFGIHMFGLIARMYIQGRPPVTNLYSSAIFVGWASVLLSLIMERVFRNGLGVATGSLVGFATLIIAHNLGLSQDTLESVRAVLDSNFWLSTHVVTVTLGYSAMFLLGVLGVIYTVSLFKKNADKDFRKSLIAMAYGTLAFAMIFSFVGTMLGGIWADQSWGRFWGWDPKENGALLIVLWCAIMLHAKLGRIVSDKGWMLMAIFANIVTSWSWFGTNMLGVGLHSYGFMDKAFFSLATFIGLNALLILIGLVKRDVMR